MTPEEQISADLDAFGEMVTQSRRSLEELSDQLIDPEKGLLVKNSLAIERLTTQVRFQWYAIGLLIAVIVVEAVRTGP